MRILVLTVALVPVWGQTSITGVVTDPSGALLSGTRLNLDCNGRLSRTRTNRAGQFRFDRPGAGPCLLSITLPPFQPFQLKVTPPQSALSIQLSLAELRQELTVQSTLPQLSVEPAGNRDALVLDKQTLDLLPTMNGDIVQAASRYLDPAVTGTDGVSLVVDGMETDKLGVTASAINEVRINQNPYSAEYSRPGHSRIEVITKQETSDYHGELRARARHSVLDARNAFALERPLQRRMAVEGHFTGPIGKSRRTSFLLSGEADREDEQSLIVARNRDGLLQQLYPQPGREYEFSARINHRPSDTRMLSIRYELERQSIRGAGVGGFSLPETAFTQRERDNDLYMKQVLFHSPQWMSEMQFRIRRDSETTRSLHPGRPRIVVEDSFTAGGAQQDTLSSRTGAEGVYVVSASRGRHYLRAGAALRDLTRYSDRDLTNREGTFFFAGLADLETNRPYSFIQQRGNPTLTFWNADAALFLQDDFKLRSNLTLGAGLRWERRRWPADGINFAPRVSAAWSPGRSSGTVLRAGVGIFYDRMRSSSAQDVLRFDGQRLLRFVLTDPGYPDPFSAGAGGITPPPSVVRFDPSLRSPYLVHRSFTVEHRLAGKTTLSIGYSGLSAAKQFRSRDLNTPLAAGLPRPDPSFAVIRQIESSARLAGDSLLFSLRGNLTPWMQGTARYRIGYVRNDSSGIDVIPANSRDLSQEWSRADFDRRHRLDLLATIKAGSLFDLGIAAELDTGRPYNLTTGRDDNGDGLARDRPAGIPRNHLQGPGSFTLDARWSRKFKLHSDQSGPSVALQMDAFNLLNRVNFSRVIGNLSSPFFGSPVAAGSARRMQAGLKFEF